MRRTGLHAALWAVFAAVTLAGGYTMLKACDLGTLFGALGCPAPAADRSLAAERERQDKLRADLHSAEIRLVQLPICPLPPKPKPLEQVQLPDPVKPPEPLKPPEAVKPLEPEPKPKQVEKFEVPRKLEGLKGCWQSVEGDIHIVTDDAERRHVGNARFCYCFGNNGRGTAQERFSDGEICRAPLTAKIGDGKVFMHHGKIPCRRHGNHVGEDITCANNESNETTCEIQLLGKTLQEKFTEQYVRVSEEYCDRND
jgi:hypothetical protein